MFRKVVLAWLALLLSLSAGAQAKSGTGCVKCHAAQAIPALVTPMGRAMQVHGSNATLAAHPDLTFTKAGYTYRLQTRGNTTQYSVTDGTSTLSVPITWSMGAEAQTWILERDGVMYESLVSYYPVLNGLDITTGDERLHPGSLLEAFGRPLSSQDAKACFNCHATGAVTNHKLSLDIVQPGLTCEHCHTDAAPHMARISHGDDTVLPKDLRDLSTEGMSNFCGQCHRTWDTVLRAHWQGVANVRFQPYRLTNSRCYDGTDPRISCIACHNPHENVKHDVAFYDNKCLTCHAPAVTASATANTNGARSCPVAKINCTSCHMPKVPLPNGHLTFTDHQIRIAKAGDPFPN